MESVAESPSQLLAFGDYLVIGAMVLISSGAGLYYGITKKKQSSLFDYFLASREMTLIPVALSTFATFVGPGTIMGTATESYNFGMQIVWWCIMEILITYIMNWIFIPLFYKMGSMNIHKFLEIRYNRKMKIVVTTMVSIASVFHTSNNLFATSIAFTQATNIDSWVIIGILAVLCVIYTSLGGMKGVMWADVIQACVIIVSLLVIVVMGLIHVGGVGNVWQRSYDTGRLEIFDFDMDPSKRNTFWTSTIGYFLSLLSSWSTGQIVQQRFLTAPSVEDAKRGNILKLIIFASTLFIIQFIGIMIYADYYSCDPIKSKSIRNINQLVPTFVMKVMGEYPMLPGLFFAGLLAASMSTLSSSLNSTPAILFETFVQPWKSNMNAKQANIICKLLCVCMSILAVLLVFVTKNFPNVKQAAVSFNAMYGPLLVLFLFGLIFPEANSKAALLSFLSGILVTTWLIVGGLLVKQPLKTKALSIEGCFVGNATFATEFSSSFSIAKNITMMNTSISPWSDYFPFHSISYLWIPGIGIVVSSTVFIILSQIFEKEKSPSTVVEVIPEALQRFHHSLSKPWKKTLLCDVYGSDEKIDKVEEIMDNFL